MNKKQDLLVKIDDLSLFLNEEIINYLISLVNLEVSVFNNEEYNYFLRNIDSFIDIAYYNICNRAIKVIKRLDINKDDLIYNDGLYNFNISLRMDPETCFLNVNRPNINNKCILTILEDFDYLTRIKKYLEEIENSDKLKKSFGYITSFSILKEKTEYLNEKIEFLENYGFLLEYYSNIIYKALLDDWKISLGEIDLITLKSEEKSFVRRLSCFDIYKIN